MADANSMLLNRLEGRLFVEHGRLYYVLHVDRKTGTARVSVREDGRQTVVELPVHEIGAKVGACNHLILDGLESQETASRVSQEAGGWFYKAREGKFGPFDTEEQAQTELKKYIIAVQGADVEYEGRLAKVS
ncbi:MAG: hypothetical protein GKR90_16545 [Pseudomonadales bacterium]|nr:hypothetical protein [Pseudomonadales bacterium]